MEARIHIIVGHYGSGKTEFSINYALRLKETFEKVYLVDLDIVNPYFRTNDIKARLEDMGLSVIASPYASSNVDVPALPAEVNRVFADPNAAVVFDVGGDDDGAIALGRYKQFFDKEQVEMLFVINVFRPMTATAEQIQEMVFDIETVSRQKVTALVNSSNLAGLTTASEVVKGQSIVDEAVALTGLPCRYITATKEVAAALPAEFEKRLFIIRRFMSTGF
ncbi:MAG: hypothetical protein E7393_00760 [Ruminococcaceae bacterium]|nr:hypothetical protein [Oscillospiraceae bacterium]